MIASHTSVNLDIFRKYAGVSLPRHVSYPMPTWWHDINKVEAATMFRKRCEHPQPRDMSLYLHVPFCQSLCKFCACLRGIQDLQGAGGAERTEAYVVALQTEIRQLGESAAGDRTLKQIHWGGGTPTYLSEGQIARIHETVTEAFLLADDAEIAMEIDPRATTEPMLRTLRGLGSNRLSMGIQDFDEKVQKHVRRIQPYEMVRDFVALCRAIGFPSLNFDLIYGMPYQTPESMRDAVEKTIGLSADRVAYYHYAQIPEKIATQRGMDYTKLPDSETKLEMFLVGLELFTAAGYEFIGLDHFAKTDEALSVALEQGTLQRNFQGMTTGGDLDLLAVGASSISHLAGIGFLQNIKDTDAYITCMKRGESPIERGKRLTPDDYLRQTIISRLYCMSRLDPKEIEEQFDIDFASRFAREINIMKELERDGLVSVDGDGRIEVTVPLGRVLQRNVAAVFDAYLRPDAYLVGEEACFSANA